MPYRPASMFHFPLTAEIAERADRRRAVLQQELLELRIRPGPGDDLRAVARTDLVLIAIDDRVQGGRIDQPFLRQQRFQRPHAQIGIRKVGVIVAFAHDCNPLVSKN